MLEYKRAMHRKSEGKKNTWKEYCMGKVKNISIFWRMIKLKRLSYLQVINDIRDLSEAYQYFKKKYKEKWKKKT